MNFKLSNKKPLKSTRSTYKPAARKNNTRKVSSRKSNNSSKSNNSKPNNPRPNTAEREKQAGKNKVWILITFLGFVLLFTYLSLNLKNIEMGYQMKALLDKETRLQEEIDKLKSDKARLLNLERVEREVTKKLGYQYPTPDQFIKVFEE